MQSNALIYLIILFGFALRLYGLTYQPLWWDEGWSLYFTSLAWRDLLDSTANNIHPPLYYLLLKLWLTLLGTTAETARLFSVMVGTVLIPTVYALGVRLLTARLALTAASLTALMPLAVYYSHEVRMYGLVTLLTALSMVTFARLTDASGNRLRLRNRYTYAYILTTTAALYTMYYALFIPLAQGVYLLWRNGLRWASKPAGLQQPVSKPKGLDGVMRCVFLAWCGIALLYLPWVMYAAPRLLSYVSNKQDVEGYRPLSLMQFTTDHVTAFSVGYLPDPFSIYLRLTVPLFALLIILGSGRLIWRLLRPTFIRRNGNKNENENVSYARPVWDGAPLLLCYLLIPLGLGYLVNLVAPFHPPTYQRTLLLSAPAFWLILAVGVEGLTVEARRSKSTNVGAIATHQGETPPLRHFIAGLIYLPSAVVGRWQSPSGRFSIALALTLALTLVNLTLFHTLPRYTESDYRPMLRDIAARATTQDVILASYQWQVGFYQAYLPSPRPQIVTVPDWGRGWDATADGQRPQMEEDLTRLLTQTPRLWFPAHQIAGRIWEEAAEAHLTQLGYPTLTRWYSPQTKLTLTGGRTVSACACFSCRRQEQPMTLDCLGNHPNNLPTNFANHLTLTTAAVSTHTVEAGRGIIPIELTWRLNQRLTGPHRVSLRLADETGRTWSLRDSLPQGGLTRFDDLATGQMLRDHHGLLVEAGTPPGAYRLLLSVRRLADAAPLDLLDATGQPLGVESLLATITVRDPTPPVGVAALPMQTRLLVDVDDSVRLLGFTRPDGAYQAGGNLPLTLFWQATQTPPADLTVQLDLLDASGEVAFRYQQPPHRPVDTWSAGMLLRDPHDLPLPPTLPPAEYRLRLTVPNENEKESQLLTSITTTDRARTFTPPTPQIAYSVNLNQQAELVGFDLPQSPLTAGEEVRLTLYWRVTAPLARSWKVFVHLLDEQGRLVTQRDQLPGGGQFPTTSWLPGEYLTDTYRLTLPPETPPGSYTLSVGFYDANDFSRLPVVNEQGEIVADHIRLSAGVVVNASS